MTGNWKSVLVTGLIGVLASCGAATKGDEGTESHWLTACSTDEECVAGACWCGRCTVRCDDVADCPHPLNQCAQPGTGPFDDSCDVPQGALCSVYDDRVLESVYALKETIATRCDQGRQTLFSVSKGMNGQGRAAPAGESEYYLFAGGVQSAGVVRVDREGTVLQELPVPSDLSPELNDLLPLSDGRVVLAGTTRGFAGPTGWIGVVDTNWQLVWERELEGSGGNNLALLPDGGLIVAGPLFVSAEGEQLAIPGMASFDVDGNVEWQASMELEGYIELTRERDLAVVAGQPRVVAQTSNGLVIISADDTGELSTQLLDTTLALYLSGVTALPNDRLAISSSRVPGAVVTVVEADGSVLWEESYGRDEDAESTGIAYDATREQIVVAGNYRGADGGTSRTWMIATDLDGEQQWELTRLPQETKGAEGLVTSVSPNRGPVLDDVIVGADGTLVAPGFTTFDLSFFVVGTSSCE